MLTSSMAMKLEASVSLRHFVGGSPVCFGHESFTGDPSVCLEHERFVWGSPVCFGHGSFIGAWEICLRQPCKSQAQGIRWRLSCWPVTYGFRWRMPLSALGMKASLEVPLLALGMRGIRASSCIRILLEATMSASGMRDFLLKAALLASGWSSSAVVVYVSPSAFLFVLLHLFSQQGSPDLQHLGLLQNFMELYTCMIYDVCGVYCKHGNTGGQAVEDNTRKKKCPFPNAWQNVWKISQ